MDYRISEIKSMIPKDVSTILDIGSQENLFNDFNTITLDYSEAGSIYKTENKCLENQKHINQDLNKNQKLKLKDNSVDMVILSQILEHLVHVEEIIAESRRVAKKYTLIGLPNEARLDSRIKILFGRFPQFPEAKYGVYCPFGHKHFFTIKTAARFVKGFFGIPVKIKYIFGFWGASSFPVGLKKFLAKNFPTLFAGQVYYLIRLNKTDSG